MINGLLSNGLVRLINECDSHISAAQNSLFANSAVVVSSRAKLPPHPPPLVISGKEINFAHRNSSTSAFAAEAEKFFPSHYTQNAKTLRDSMTRHHG